MKITINRKELIDALSVGGAMAGKVKTVPILEYAKIGVSNIALSVSSFDLECSITTRIDSNSDTNGSFCVNVSDLSKALKSISHESVALDVSDSKLIIQHESGVMEMGVYDAISFPTIPHDNSAEYKVFVLPSESLKEWISVGKNFASNDDLRPVMGGLYMHLTSSYIEVCATDAHKLYTDKVEVIDFADGIDIEAVLPLRAFTSLMSILNDCNEVTMCIDSKNFIFTTSNTELVCRKIEGNYPNFKAIIPTHSTAVKVDKQHFISAVNRVALFANKDTSLVKMNILAKNIILEGQDIDFSRSSTDSVDSELLRGETLSIGAKADFINICLSSVFADDVILEFGDSNRPILFQDSMRPNKTILLMPMMIN